MVRVFCGGGGVRMFGDTHMNLPTPPRESIWCKRNKKERSVQRENPGAERDPLRHGFHRRGVVSAKGHCSVSFKK